MPDEHPARLLFDRLTLDEIKRFVDDKQQEHVHLEFKTATKSGQLDRIDRKNFARAASGFANADGGVIVWGIEAKKDNDGVDCATALAPFDNAQLALSTLNSLTGDATGPLVEGIEHREFIEQGDTGYVATLIPPSDSGPHMAKLGEDRYYKRSGDSSRRMEHFDIEDMFGRRAKPVLSLALEWPKLHSYPNPKREEDGEPRALCEGSPIVRIWNMGRGVARFPQLDLMVERPYTFAYHGLDGNFNHGLDLRPTPSEFGGHIFAGGSDDVVHLDSSLDITRLEVRGISSTPAYNKPLIVSYRLSALGTRPTKGQLEVTSEQLAEMAKQVEKTTPPPP